MFAHFYILWCLLYLIWWSNKGHQSGPCSESQLHATHCFCLCHSDKERAFIYQSVWINLCHKPLCYDASGPWIGTKLRYLDIMKTSSPAQLTILRPARRQRVPSPRLTGFIAAHSHRPSLLCAQSFVIRLHIWIHLYTFWTLIIAGIERERGGWEATGWGGFRKTQQVTELTGNTHSIYSVQSPNPPWDKLQASILSNNCWKVSSLLVKQYRQYFN